MEFEMTLRENLMLMALLSSYRKELVKNQRLVRSSPDLANDTFWAERNRAARHLYRRLTVAM